VCVCACSVCVARDLSILLIGFLCPCCGKHSYASTQTLVCALCVSVRVSVCVNVCVVCMRSVCVCIRVCLFLMCCKQCVCVGLSRGYMLMQRGESTTPLLFAVCVHRGNWPKLRSFFQATRPAYVLWCVCVRIARVCVCVCVQMCECCACVCARCVCV